MLAATRPPPTTTLGACGRLGRWTATHARAVAVTWAVLVVGLGVLAPRVETALSGAGWQSDGSESVAARHEIDRAFSGAGSYALQVAIVSDRPASPALQATIARVRSVLGSDPDVSGTQPARLSADGRTAIVVGDAGAPPDEMVRAAHRLADRLTATSGNGVRVALTGSAAMWSDFNVANRDAMLKSELFSWPVTLGIMLLAFGSLVAAGLPLLLAILGLTTTAGMLFLGTRLFDISIWAMNFALMFALALGIDYALFIVARFRRAQAAGLAPIEATADAMDTAGKAVALSGVTVLVSLSAVMLVPSPAFQSMALGIMLAVSFVLAASLTLLPALLARIGPRIDRFSPPWRGDRSHRSARLAGWTARVWRRPVVASVLGLACVGALAWPVAELHTGMPSIKVVPRHDSSRVGYAAVQAAFGRGAPGTLQIVGPRQDAASIARVLHAARGITGVGPEQTAGNRVLVAAIPVGDPSGPRVRTTIERLRTALPAGVLVGGSVAENLDLERELARATPRVIGVVLALGFLLLLAALRAPVLALGAVLLNVLATVAAFGVAKWIFQDGVGAGLLGIETQGFIDAWAPVFFFAMLFALGMDYTVFLLASAKEGWERSGSAERAAVEGVATSGKVITAAAAVMVAVFFTFALSGPLPPREMGIILGIAVLVDAALVRLVLMPALLRLLGPRAWWTPRWLATLLPEIRFGHA